MKTLPISSLALGVCLLTLSAGVAFANDIHTVTVGGVTTTVTSGGHTGTGSNTTSSNGTTGTPIAGCGTPAPTAVLGAGAKMNPGNGSPFNPDVVAGTVTKTYAGSGVGNLSNPNANSQYDNACAQAAAHQLH
jgi:hypothetical protein